MNKDIKDSLILFYIITLVIAIYIGVSAYKMGNREGRQQLTDQIVNECKSPNIITQSDLDSNRIIIVKFMPWKNE